jgi:tetratricopeptide (TPR) repeat protein
MRHLHRTAVAALACLVALCVLFPNWASADVRDDARLLIDDGVAYYGAGDTNKALAAFGQAVDLDPANPISYFNMGVINLEAELYRDALEDFGMAIDLAPQGFAAPFVNHGVASAAQMNLEMAVIDYTNAIKADPEDPIAYFDRGLAYQRMRQLNRALATVVVNPVDASKLDFSLFAQSREAQLALAIEDFTRAAELDPGFSAAFRNRGLAYAESEDYGSAFRDYDKAIALDMKDPVAYFYRGTAHGRMQDFNRALVDLDRAIQFDPTLVEAFNARGAVLTIVGDLEGALEDFDRALTLDPRNYDAYNLRGVVHTRLGDTRNAMYDFQRAVDIDQTRPEAYDNRALAFSEKEDYEKAMKDCDEAMRLAPGYAETYMTKSTACERTVAPRHAAESYRNFIRYASPETGIQIRLARELYKPVRGPL